jgi:tetratricopeptide (TPR) repeat protein
VESKKQRWNQALLLREEVCRLNPKDTASQIRKAWSLAGLNRYEESIKVLTPISRDPEETAGLRSRATHALGDILWLSGDPASAERLYTTLLNEPLTAASHRAIWIKQQTTREAKEPWARGIRNYLINTSMKGKERRKSLRDALIENPRHPLLLYLTGKLDQIRGKPSGAAESLKQAVPHLTFPLLKGEALRALGAALLHLGHPKEALEKFEEMEKTLPRNREGLIAEAIDWSRRAQYQLNTGSGSRP